MRILVISDSHNFVLNSQIERMNEHGKFEMLIHCGDKYRDAEKFADRLNINKVIQVPGNCDSISDKPLLINEVIEGKRFIITHGHLHHVKESIEHLKDYAEEENADVVIYGHTHCAQNEVIDNILFFNPGSSIMPKCGEESFGILELSPENIEGFVVSLEN